VVRWCRSLERFTVDLDQLRHCAIAPADSLID
jgi:hypothetical protein